MLNIYKDSIESRIHNYLNNNEHIQIITLLYSIQFHSEMDLHTF